MIDCFGVKAAELGLDPLHHSLWFPRRSGAGVPDGDPTARTLPAVGGTSRRTSAGPKTSRCRGLTQILLNKLLL